MGDRIRPEEARKVSTTRTFVCGDYHWRLLPSLRVESLSRVWEAFPRVREMPGARILKENRLRTVGHVPHQALREDSAREGLPPSDLIVKVYRYPGSWDRLRYLLIRHRARKEHHALEKLKRLGLPVPECYGSASLRRAGLTIGGGLLLEFLADAVPLSERLERDAAEAGERAGGVGAHPGAGQPASPSGLLARAGKLVRLLHDRGVWHRDLHGGNLLCVGREDALVLIDVHSCCFLPWMPRSLRLRDVAKLVHSLGTRLPPQGVEALLSEYGADALRLEAGEPVESLVLREVERIEERRLRSRSKRCLLPSSRFAVHRERGGTLFHLRDFSREALAEVCGCEPPAGANSLEPLTHGGASGWSCRLGLGGLQVEVHCRRYSLLQAAKGILARHPLRRVYACGHALGVRGIPTPQVVALYEKGRLRWIRRTHLVVEAPTEGVTLRGLLQEGGARAGEPPCANVRRRHTLAREIGRLLRTLHDARLDFRDLSAGHILIRARQEPGSENRFVEECGIRHPDFHVRSRPFSREERMARLKKFASGLQGPVRRTDLLRGLRAYAGEDLPWRHLARAPGPQSCPSG